MSNSVIMEIIDGKIAAVFLNEPDSLNALSASIKEDLINVLTDIERNDNLKVVILAGKGRAFCAGGDIKAMKRNEHMTAQEIKDNMDYTVQIITKIYRMKKPIVCAVHGYAAGAGFSLALASDMTVAEEDSKFVLAFKNVGLIPDLGGHYFLYQAVGAHKAKEWIWTGKKISAAEGEAFGFINRVVGQGEAFKEALRLAQQLIDGPHNAYSETKSIINSMRNSELEQVLEVENNAQSSLRISEDHKEGLAAFFEKRPPGFNK
jgi:2-(1,2-epoxy-1,2-dihydrophenyl)acetyl-CoA isomerase